MRNGFETTTIPNLDDGTYPHTSGQSTPISASGRHPADEALGTSHRVSSVSLKHTPTAREIIRERLTDELAISAA